MAGDVTRATAGEVEGVVLTVEGVLWPNGEGELVLKFMGLVLKLG
jgi:hypothetical protein